MNKDERPSIRTQFLVFTLFGDYVLTRGGSIWTSSLLSLLDLLGVSERAARSTLSRMSRKGWVTAVKHGRRSQYSLTARGWMLLKQGEKRIFEPPLTDWDRHWYLVVYSLPEEKRRLRHSLRQALTWLGFGSLAPGTWISPHNRNIEVKNICNDLGIREHVEMFHGVHTGLAPEEDIVHKCWDLKELEAEYQEFINHYQSEFEECRSDGSAENNLPADTCFVQRFWLTHEFQAFPRKDPNLPAALLPPDWKGFEARRLFEDYRRLLEVKANQFMDEIVGEERSKEASFSGNGSWSQADVPEITEEGGLASRSSPPAKRIFSKTT